MDKNIPNYLKSFIRLLHASPQTPSVDVYINNMPIIRDLRYKGFTEYIPITAGTYNIKIYKTGSMSNLLLNTNVTIQPNKIFTIAAIGKDPRSLSLYTILDPKINIDNSKVYLRFAQLSPNTPPIDVVTGTGQMLFRNVSYKELKGYLPLLPSIYSIDIRLSGTPTSVLYVPNIRLKANKFYTIYSVGLLNDEPPLQVLIPLDGNSYIQFYS